MAINNVRIKTAGGMQSVPVIVCNTEAAATNIKAGEPVKAKVDGSKYVIPVADAEPIIGTTTNVLGIAASTSTETASADGTVSVYQITPETILVAKAKSSTAADTEAEITALLGKRVLFDLTSSTYTIDTAVADADVNGLIVVGGNADRKEIWVQVRNSAIEGDIV